MESTNVSKWSGVYTALATPFFSGELDRYSLVKLVEDQLASGVDGFVALGTTAEAAMLTPLEKRVIVNLICEVNQGQVPVLVGITDYTPKLCLENLSVFSNTPIDGYLCAVPPYVKPNQEGLYRHFRTIALGADKPLMLYNVPGRSVAVLESSTVLDLVSIPKIMGLKEASGQLDMVRSLSKILPSSFSLFSGDDPTFLSFSEAGGVGVVSVASHLLCRQMKDAYRNQTRQVDFDNQFGSLVAALYCESNPVPVKRALYEVGLFRSPEMRLPLVSLNAEKAHFLAKILGEAGFERFS